MSIVPPPQSCFWVSESSGNSNIAQLVRSSYKPSPPPAAAQNIDLLRVQACNFTNSTNSLRITTSNWNLHSVLHGRPCSLEMQQNYPELPVDIETARTIGQHLSTCPRALCIVQWAGRMSSARGNSIYTGIWVGCFIPSFLNSSLVRCVHWVLLSNMSGLRKAKKYDWKDSNLALFGSDVEKNVSCEWISSS